MFPVWPHAACLFVVFVLLKKMSDFLFQQAFEQLRQQQQQTLQQTIQQLVMYQTAGGGNPGQLPPPQSQFYLQNQVITQTPTPIKIFQILMALIDQFHYAQSPILLYQLSLISILIFLLQSGFIAFKSLLISYLCQLGLSSYEISKFYYFATAIPFAIATGELLRLFTVHFSTSFPCVVADF